MCRKMPEIFNNIAMKTMMTMIVMGVMENEMGLLSTITTMFLHKKIGYITRHHRQSKQSQEYYQSLVGHVGHHPKSLVTSCGYQVCNERTKTYDIMCIERHSRICADAPGDDAKKRRYEYLQA